jgi:4'-phosphopantetheinyl transferase EntD
MTHCAGYGAVAHAHRITSFGIDAESNSPLPEGVLDAIARSEERTALASLPAVGPAWDRLLFSAKESVYKAWYPVTRRWLDFQEASLDLDPDPDPDGISSPHASSHRLCLHSLMRGRWVVDGEHVVTAVVVEKT